MPASSHVTPEQLPRVHVARRHEAVDYPLAFRPDNLRELWRELTLHRQPVQPATGVQPVSERRYVLFVGEVAYHEIAILVVVVKEGADGPLNVTRFGRLATTPDSVAERR